MLDLARSGHHEPQALSSHRTVADAARAMARSDADAVVVVRDGQPVGIVTERDIVRRVVGKGLDPAATRLGDVMTAHPITLGRESPVQEALALMRQGGFRHLPITGEDGRLLAVVSAPELASEAIDQLEHEIEALEAYLAYDGSEG